MEFKRNSSRSSLRATPLFTTITKRKTNRKTGYDQLESTIDQGDHDENFENTNQICNDSLVDSNSHYMTLINQSDDENKNAFENINFYSSLSQIIPSNSNNPPTQSVSSPAAIVAPIYSRKKTPPPIPKRRQSHQSSISSIESNRNKPLKSVHSSIDVVSSSSDTSAVQKPPGRPQSTVPPRATPTVRDHLRNSPVPMLPAPPRRDSRKGRKRPPCLDSTAIGGVGSQIFPHLEPKGLSSSLTMDIIPRTEPPNIRTSASHDFNETKNRLNHQNPLDPDHDSEDGFSFLIPQIDHRMKIKENETLFHENQSGNIGPYEQSSKSSEIDQPMNDDQSDFEIIDLFLKNSDDELQVNTPGSIKGSTNNLADFDSDCDSEAIASGPVPTSLTLPRSYSTEYACSEGTQTPSSEVDCEFPDPFQTEKLLKTSFELESDQGENIFNAFVKLPRGRKHRIRGRSWSQVQLSLSTGALQIFSEDARLIETIPFYTDVQLSNIYIQHINNKLFYFIKLFKVTYKAKRSWGITIRGYSEYLSNESNFSNYVSRLRPIIKIGTRDYSAINSLAKSISNALAVTDKISEDTNLLTPSTYCRVVIEVFDEINFLIDSFGMIQSSQIESSIRSLTFGTDKVVLALNDEKANLNYFDEADTLKHEKEWSINPINIRLHSVIKENTGGYEKQRLIKFNPINGAKLEVMRFNTQMRDDARLPLTLKTEYTIFGNSISITSSLHLNEIERIKNLVIRFPISHCWKDAIKESTFNSITSGTYILEDRSLLWKLNEITNSDAKQEFMSVKFSPPKLTILNTMKYCQLEFELDDTRLSGTLLKAISLKTKNQEIEKNVNYRSYYTLRVGIQLKP
jgi:hypothetical protein